MTEPIPVRVRACACPDTPHPDGDIVYIRPTLSLAGGIAAERVLAQAIVVHPLSEGASDNERLRVALERKSYLMDHWTPLFIEHGATGWNLDRPFSTAAILEDWSLARALVDILDERYSEAVLAPFQTPPDEHSQSGPTDGGTSRPTAPTRSPRARSSLPASAASQP